MDVVFGVEESSMWTSLLLALERDGENGCG